MSFRRTSGSFTVVSNELAQDEGLSLACVGMLVYLLSKPPGWEGHNYDIERRGGFGWRVRRKLTQEAELAGYLKFVMEHKDGRLNCFYEVYAEKLPVWERTDSSKMSQKKQPHQDGVLVQPHQFEVLHGEALHGGGDIDNKDQQIKDTKKREVEVHTSATTPLIQLIQEKTGLQPESCELLLERDPDDTLVIAALDCWLDRISRRRDLSGENPIGFLRGCISNPGAFGVVMGKSGWYYPNASKIKMPVIHERIDAAASQIRNHRLKGASDPFIKTLVMEKFREEEIEKAFEKVGGFRG